MDLIKSHAVIEPVIDILEHIKGVQADMITLSEQASTTFYDLLESQNVPMTDEAVTAFQYQDIFSQQLNAIISAVSQVTHQLSLYIDHTKDEKILDEQLETLRENLNSLLDDARNKKKKFMGHALGEEEEFDINELR